MSSVSLAPYLSKIIMDYLNNNLYPLQQRMQYARPGPYITVLTPDEEKEFKVWVKQNNVPFEDDNEKSGYDLRGFWRAMKAGSPIAKSAINPFDKQIHYPDRWKTPYSTEGFSNESIYALPNAPRWTGNNKEGWKLVDSKGNILKHQGP